MRTTSNKKNSNLFISGVVVLTISNVLIKVIGMALKIPLHALLSGDGMGYYNIAYQIYVWFYMISTAGLPVAVSIMIAESRTKGNIREVNRIFGITVKFLCLIGLAGTTVMMAGSTLFAAMYKQPGAYLSIIAIAPTLLFICVSSALRGYFQGYQMMLPTAISQLIEAFGKLSIGILFAIVTLGQGLESNVVAATTVLGLTIGVAGGMVFLIFYKFRFKSAAYDEELVLPDSDTTTVRSGRSIAKNLLMIAVPVTLSASVMPLMNIFDGAIISRQLQAIGFTESLARIYLGDYSSLAVSLWNFPPALIYPISYSIVPLITAARTAGDKSRIKMIMDSALKVAALIALPCSLGMSVLSEPILKIFFEDGAAERTAPLLSILSLSIFFLGMVAISNAILQVFNQERKPIISMLAGGVVKVLMSYILIGIPSIGIFGAPISTFFCYLTIMLFNCYFMARHVGLIPNVMKVLVRPLIASVLSAGAALLTYKLLSAVIGSAISTFAAIAAAALVYGILIFLIGALTREEIALLPKGDKLCRVFEKLHLLR